MRIDYGMGTVIINRVFQFYKDLEEIGRVPHEAVWKKSVLDRTGLGLCTGHAMGTHAWSVHRTARAEPLPSRGGN